MTRPGPRIICLLTLTAGLVAILGVQSLELDFPVTDGGFYFEQAQLWAGGKIQLKREWSPLFIMGYGLLHRVVPGGEPLLLFLLHRMLVLYATVLLFWVMTGRLFPGRTALCLSLGLLGLEGILYDFRVVHTAGLGVVLILCCVGLRNRRGAAWHIMGVSCLGGWIRPELWLLLPALAGWLLFQALTGGRIRPRWRSVALFWLALAGSLGLYGSTQAPVAGSRSFDAFSQHFVWGELRDSEGSLLSGHVDHRGRTREVFGPVKSVTQAMAANPAAFLGHLLRNLAELLRVLPSSLLPGGSRGVGAPILFVLLLLRWGQPIRGRLPALFLVVVVASAGTSLLVSLVIAPSAAYLLPAAPLCLMVMADLLARLKGRMGASQPEVWKRRLQGPLWAAGLCVLVVLLIPPLQGKRRQVVDLSESLLREASGEVVLYAFSGVSYCAYVRSHGRACHYFPVTAVQNVEQLAGPIHEKRVSSVIVDDFLRRYHLDSGSSALDLFERTPGQWGFQPITAVDGLLGDARLYSRREF